MRWLTLAVLLPLLVLAALAWIGTRAQLKAAWTDAREEASRIVAERSATLAQALDAAVLTIPRYPDPPIPGNSSEKDAILDSTDLPALSALRDDPEAGLSPAGLPRRALAALRIHALDPTAQSPSDLTQLLTRDAPSILTTRALQQTDPAALPDWLLAEQARRLAGGRGQAALILPTEDSPIYWVQSNESNISYLLTETLNVHFDHIAFPLPSWASLSIAPPAKPALATAPLVGNRSLQLIAAPAILEKSIRRQQDWTLALLATAVLVAAISLFSIHRSVARERHLAELKSQFVASVSHELRAPIGSIRLMAEALQQEKVRHPAEFHQLIAREGARLSHLIENVLDFSRIEDGRKQYRFEECDLTALIRDTLRLMQPLAHDHDVHFTDELPEITATVDPAAIQQALVNLLDNAIKFSPKNGTVHIEAACKRSSSPPSPDSGHPTAVDSIQITIRDHGPGIPKSEQQKIFQRFHRLGNELRRETQGAGIGLSIVKHIAEAHHGTITVQCPPKKGTTFTLSLPNKPLPMF